MPISWDYISAKETWQEYALPVSEIWEKEKEKKENPIYKER